MSIIVEAFLVFLPAGVANMTPVVASKIPGLKQMDAPISKTYLGVNKTWRGLIAGALAGGSTAALLHLFSFWDEPNITMVFVVFYGIAVGFGALLGDVIESFFKRKKGIKSGKSWFPFDQIDYIIGGLLFALPFGMLTWPLVSTIFVLYFGLHLLVSYIGYLLGLKSRPI